MQGAQVWPLAKEIDLTGLNCRYTNVDRCSIQSLSCVWLFATPWTAAHQASLSITNSRSLPKFMSIESVMLSNHLILCHPLLLLPSIFCHSFSSKEQASFNFMAAVTICSDFGAQENKVCHCFHCFLIYLPWTDETGCHDLLFLNVEF